MLWKALLCFDRSLIQDPDSALAKRNRELVKTMIDERDQLPGPIDDHHNTKKRKPKKRK